MFQIFQEIDENSSPNMKKLPTFVEKEQDSISMNPLDENGIDLSTPCASSKVSPTADEITSESSTESQEMVCLILLWSLHFKKMCNLVCATRICRQRIKMHSTLDLGFGNISTSRNLLFVHGAL